jgi:uncharacterized protein YcfJ
MSAQYRQAKTSTAAKWARLVLPVLLVPSVALASTTYDQARVIGADPIYENVTVEVPVRECRTEQIAYPRASQRASATGPILGAIIGGALGNAVGHKKRNKQVGTVVGAVLGGSIGADMTRRHRGYRGDEVTYRTEEVCHVVNEVRTEQRFTGYDVRYVYGGTTYSTVMPHDPGQSIRVRVSVRPVH